MPERVDLYFDFISPYAYLGFLRLAALCDRRGAELALHPVLFAGLLNRWGQLGPAEIPPKRAWTFKDCLRTARLAGVDFCVPPAHPFNPLAALRLSLPEVAGRDQRRVVEALFRACWGRGADITSAEELRKILDEANLDGAALLAKTADPAVKEVLKQSTEQAIAIGVFGVPTMIVNGGELYWGADRVDHVEIALDGRDPLTPADIEVVLAHPAAAFRRERNAVKAASK
jgi:2-hydroxychromene-2-carboxylate isomerase